MARTYAYFADNLNSRHLDAPSALQLHPSNNALMLAAHTHDHLFALLPLANKWRIFADCHFWQGQNLQDTTDDTLMGVNGRRWPMLHKSSLAAAQYSTPIYQPCEATQPSLNDHLLVSHGSCDHNSLKRFQATQMWHCTFKVVYPNTAPSNVAHIVFKYALKAIA